MSIKERLKKYYTRKSKLGLASDIIFVLLVIMLIIPQTRVEVMGFVQKIRVAIWNPSINEKGSAVKLGTADYNLEFEKPDGTKYSFESARGKVIFLNLWATWCPPCVAEMPAIQELFDKYKENDQVEFLMVSNEEPSKVSEFMNRKGYTFPVYINQYQLPEAFQTNSIPTTFVVSKSGDIIINQVGAANWSGSKMIETMDRLINEKTEN